MALDSRAYDTRSVTVADRYSYEFFDEAHAPTALDQLRLSPPLVPPNTLRGWSKSCNTNSKWRTAAILKNRKIAISQQ